MSRSPMSIAVAESMRCVPRINEPSTALPDSTAILNRCYGRRLAPIRCDGSGRGGGWADVRGYGRAARETSGAAGARGTAWAEDSYLRRRAVQFYESALRAAELHRSEERRVGKECRYRW